MVSFDERAAALGCEPAWTKREAALYLGISENTLDSLNVPRAALRGCVRFHPEEVRAWLRRQLSPQPPEPAALTHSPTPR